MLPQAHEARRSGGAIQLKRFHNDIKRALIRRQIEDCEAPCRRGGGGGSCMTTLRTLGTFACTSSFCRNGHAAQTFIASFDIIRENDAVN